MKITKEFRNELLKRKEFELVIEAPSNPGYKKTSEIIAEELKVPAENICIKSLKGSFGRNEFVADVLVYDSAKDKEMIERKPRVKKKAEANAAAPAKAGGKK